MTQGCWNFVRTKRFFSADKDFGGIFRIWWVAVSRKKTEMCFCVSCRKTTAVGIIAKKQSSCVKITNKREKRDKVKLEKRTLCSVGTMLWQCNLSCGWNLILRHRRNATLYVVEMQSFLQKWTGEIKPLRYLSQTCVARSELLCAQNQKVKGPQQKSERQNTES